MSGLFTRLNRKNNKNTTELRLVEARFLSTIHGGGGQDSQAEIEPEETIPMTIMTVGVSGTHQPPP